MINEFNMVGGSDGWQIDTDASHHVCFDRAMFKTYTTVEDQKVLLEDSHTTEAAEIIGFLLNNAGFEQLIGLIWERVCH